MYKSRVGILGQEVIPTLQLRESPGKGRRQSPSCLRRELACPNSSFPLANCEPRAAPLGFEDP